MIAGFAIWVMSSSMAQAQTIWNGSYSDDWSAPENWDGGAVPSGGKQVEIDTTTPNEARIGGGIAASVGTITVGRDNEGTLWIPDGGTLSSGTAIIGSNEGSAGAVVATGAGSLWNVDQADLVVGGAGTGQLAIADGARVNVTAADILDPSSGLIVGYSGDGVLIIENGGELMTTFGTIGKSEGSTGTVHVTGEGSTWTVPSLFGFTAILVGDKGEGVLTVSDGGRVRITGDDGPLDINNGTLNIGAGIGDAAAAPGLVNARHVRIRAGGTLNFNHTATDYRFSAGISGPGTINVIAGTTILTGQLGAPTYIHDSHTNVSGGTLAVQSLLGGNVEVYGSGTLAGTGTVNFDPLIGKSPYTTIIGAGGTIAPGLPQSGVTIGTLRVQGDLAFQSGSTYEVDTDADSAKADHIAVSGEAVIEAGSSVHVNTNGTYDPSTEFTILRASGGIDGEFDDASTDYVFLVPTLRYDANNVYLSLDTANADFSALGGEGNQAAVAAALEALEADSDIYRALVLLTDETDAANALAGLSGEQHAASKQARIVRSARLRAVMLRRLAERFGGGPRNTASVDGADLAARHGISRFSNGISWRAWTDVWAYEGHADPDGSTAAMRHEDMGTAIGADATFDERWRAGAMAGYGQAEEWIPLRASNARTSDFHLGLYAGVELGPFVISTGAAHTWHFVESRRTVAFPGYFNALRASHDARTAQAFVETGYMVERKDLDLMPFAGLAWVHHRTEGFAESGGASALAAAADSMDIGSTSLGMRVRSEGRFRGMPISLHGEVAWQYAFGDLDPMTSVAFSGGGTFSVAGVSLDRNSARVEAGLEATLGPGVSLGLTYEGRFSQTGHDQGISARLRLELGG